MCSYSWRVPFHVWGDLRIVASGELGDLGPVEGEAVSFKWNLLYSLSGLVVWSILAAALLARPNRSAQGWLILVPVLVVSLFWMGFKVVVHMGSSTQSQMDPMFSALVIGLAVTGLMVPWLGRWQWPGRIFGFLVILAWVLMASIGTIAFTREAVAQVILYSICSATLLLATLVMRSRIRSEFRVSRCLLWLGLGLVVLCALILPLIVIGVLLAQHEINLLRQVPMMLLMGLVLGVVLFVVVLPFTLLMSLNAFWRQRLFALLGLAPKAENTEAEPPAAPQ